MRNYNGTFHGLDLARRYLASFVGDLTNDSDPTVDSLIVDTTPTQISLNSLLNALDYPPITRTVQITRLKTPRFRRRVEAVTHNQRVGPTTRFGW